MDTALKVGLIYKFTGYTKDCNPQYRQQLISLGLIPNAQIKVIRKAPLGDPIQIECNNTSLSLRLKDIETLNFLPLCNEHI